MSADPRPSADAPPENLLALWADVLVDALCRGGLGDVVVSPGSRSTPFLLGLLRRRTADPGALRLHSVIDERAAAFFALGIARASARPAALLCTSGTAPAHYLPAVIEASESALPLVVISADRPSWLTGTGAPQTIDQRELFGRHVRAFHDLGDPSPDELGRLHRVVEHAVARARGLAVGEEPADAPGPVHLNARADKPLEPVRTRADEPADPRSRAREDGTGSLARPGEGEGSVRRAPNHENDEERPRHDVALDRLAAALDAASRPVIVAGPLPPGPDAEVERLRAAAAKLSETRGLWLCAETTSQLRLVGDAGPCSRRADLFDRWIGDVRPDVVLEIGQTPTSAGYARWLASDAAPATRVILGGARHRDPSRSASDILLGSTGTLLEALEARLTREPCSTFDAAAEAAEVRAWEATEAAITAAGGGFDELSAVRAVVAELPEGAWLQLGNSLPIRHADRALRGPGPRLRVLCQRGVNGIDGNVAGAAGAACATGEPLALILGDVAFAHDASALALARGACSPLLLVVLDNGGGRIFEQLPIARWSKEAAEAGAEGATLGSPMPFFVTPPRLALEPLALAHGVTYAAASDDRSLRASVREALGRAGATLIHARFPPGGAAAVEALAKGQP